MAVCKRCGRAIEWEKMPDGRWRPLAPGGGRHDCPASGFFERLKAAEKKAAQKRRYRLSVQRVETAPMDVVYDILRK